MMHDTLACIISLQIETNLEPQTLLRLLQSIESTVHSIRNGLRRFGYPAV
jgi:7,8-dihydro-6-hydroxymethylpterin-pyrophosphokinase